MRRLSALMDILSAAERQRAEKFKFEKDFKLYVAGKIMARRAIADYAELDPADIEFRIDKYGRPFLKYPQINNFDFNISHSGDYVVLAISDRRVGIDVEKIKPVDFKIAETCFHDKESEYLNRDIDKRLENFYKLWTLKESFIKAVGQGLSYPLKDFYFNMDEPDKIGIRILKAPKEDREWNFAARNIDNAYQLALCTNEPGAKNALDSLIAAQFETFLKIDQKQEV